MIETDTFDILEDTCRQEEEILKQIADSISTMKEADLLRKLKEHSSLRKVSKPLLDELKALPTAANDQERVKKIETQLRNIQALNKIISQKAHNKKSLIKSELSTLKNSRNALSGYAAPNMSHAKKATGRLIKTSG